MFVNGAGASAISCTKLFVSLGAQKKKHHHARQHRCHQKKTVKGLDVNKSEFATDRNINTLEEAMHGADVFIGLSKGNILSADMLKSIFDKPVVLLWPIQIRNYLSRCQECTRRCNYGNRSQRFSQSGKQRNRFPILYWRSIRCSCNKINEEMPGGGACHCAVGTTARSRNGKLCPQRKKNLQYGPEYIIPKPLDQD